MESKGRPKGRGLKQLQEDNILFRERMNTDWENIKQYVTDKFAELDARMHRIESGHKQLIDWVGLQFMCYIPKELCLMNLLLMGMPVSEADFLRAARENRFGTPIQQSKTVKEPLYNFKMVFKYFMFNYIDTPIKSFHDQFHAHRDNSTIVGIQAKVKAEAIKRLDDGKTFVFDKATMDRLRDEIYGLRNMEKNSK